MFRETKLSALKNIYIIRKVFMIHEQKLNFHKRQFKAYLALRGITKTDVAKKIGMNEKIFRNKSIRNLKPDGHHRSKKEFKSYFTDAESKQIAEVLNMSEKWQRRIFSKVILK